MAENEENSGFETLAIEKAESQSGKITTESPKKRVALLIQLQGEGAGKKFFITKRETFIGRSSDTDIMLPDFEISRRHSVIVYENHDRGHEPPRCVLRDLNSKNGIAVNGKKTDLHSLNDKDVISLGSIALGFYIKDEFEMKFDEELFSMATVDALTGLYNKHYFQRQFRLEVQRVMRDRSALSLMFCDLDHFKRVNDTHGHLAGDYVLRKVGEILRSNQREYDVCGRYGGEEFAVLLPSTDLRCANIAAERLRARVEQTVFDYQGAIIPVTTSIGVSAFTADMRSPEDLIAAADRGVYLAKEGGRNRVVCIEGS